MIPRDEAESALKSVDQARKAATIFGGYARSGSIVMAWGLVWLIGNIGTQIDRLAGMWCWAIGIAAAILWTVTRSRGGARDWRCAAAAGTAFGYLLLIEFILGGVDAATHNAITSALVAAIYIAIGLWTGMRFVLLGLMLAAAIVVGWFVFPAWLYLWLGIGGGGTLIVTGLWLRRA